MNMITNVDDISELRRYLLRYAKLQLRDDAAAEDVVQDTLLAVHQAQTSFRGDSERRTWAAGILKHKLMDALRSKYRHMMRGASAEQVANDDAIDHTFEGMFVDDGHWAEPVPEWKTPHGNLEREQLRAALELCLTKLPANTGRVFMLREWMGYELSEVCSEFSMSGDSVRQTMHRARMLMRSCLQHTAFAPKTAPAAAKAQVLL
jgi:RNA polymerase sigma-70 factor, ECF subfamily